MALPSLFVIPVAPPRARLARAAGITLLVSAPLAALSRVSPVHDITPGLVVLVAWLASRHGRAAGLASAATAAATLVATLAWRGGVSPMALALDLVALFAAAWLAGRPARVAATEQGTSDPGQDGERFRTLAEALPQIVWTSDAAGEIDSVNQRGLDYLGLTMAQAEGCGWEQMVHQDDRAHCAERWTSALRTGAPYEVEYRLRRAVDGMYRWHIGRALPLRNAAGGIEKWIGTCTDIHCQRETADTVRKWELVFRHSSWGVMVLDDTGTTITAANPAVERMHGRPEGSMRGTALLDAVAPEAREAHAAQNARVVREGRAVFESVHLGADGTRVPVLVDTTEVRDDEGRALYRIVNCIDLTLTRAADAARETAELRFRAVQDVSPDAFVLWGMPDEGGDLRDARLRYLNPAAAALMRRPADEVSGLRMGDISPGVYESERFALYEQVYRTGVTAEVTTFHETVRRWLRLVAIRIDDGIGVISTDVSAAKEAEAVLRRSRDELEQLVADRTRELHHARDVAVQANRAKSDFLSRASHELRTPLSSVIGFSNILLKNKQGSLAADELTYLSRIAKNGRNLLALVNDLLDLSKIEAGRVDLELSPVSLFDVLYEVQDTLEPRAAELGLSLRVEVEQENDLVIADETRLRQVLVNLAGNAIKYTTRGSVVIRVITNGAGAPARIDVVDTGPGIPADRLDAIFQPFIVHATPATGDAATGLGLAITRALCDLMGYRLSVESRVGEGSTFSVHLLPGDGVKMTSAFQLASVI